MSFAWEEKSSDPRSPGSWSRSSWPLISATPHVTGAAWRKCKRWNIRTNRKEPHGTRDDWIGQDGNQHGAAFHACRTPVCRLRSPTGCRKDSCERERGRDDVARRLREETEIAPHGLDDGAGRRCRSDAED